jgi:hypothetical protein
MRGSEKIDRYKIIIIPGTSCTKHSSRESEPECRSQNCCNETIKSPENGKMTTLAVHARQENAGKRQNWHKWGWKKGRKTNLEQDARNSSFGRPGPKEKRRRNPEASWLPARATSKTPSPQSSERREPASAIAAKLRTPGTPRRVVSVCNQAVCRARKALGG